MSNSAYEYDAPPKYDQPHGSDNQLHLQQRNPPVSQQPVPQNQMYNAGYNQSPTGGAHQSHVTVNVMTQQPQQQQLRTWSTSLCGCFEDMSSCCCVTWFCPCYTCCDLSARLGESCCAPVCLAMFGHSVPLVYRTKVRAAHGIMGGAIDDCTSSMFCGPCVLCQMKRELDYIERVTGKPAFR